MRNYSSLDYVVGPHPMQYINPMIDNSLLSHFIKNTTLKDPNPFFYCDFIGNGAFFVRQGSNFGWNGSTFWIPCYFGCGALNAGWSLPPVLPLLLCLYLISCYKFSEFLLAPVRTSCNCKLINWGQIGFISVYATFVLTSSGTA